MGSLTPRRTFVSIVGLAALVMVGCGGDADDAGLTTTSSRPAPEATTPTSVAAPPPLDATTTSLTSTSTSTSTTTSSTTSSTTTSTTTTTSSTTSSTTTTTVPPVLPTWSPPVVLSDAGADSPFTELGPRARFATSSIGAVAIRPTPGDVSEAATHLWFSPDSLTWERTELIDGERLHSVVAGGPGFVAAGAADSDRPGLATSAGVLARPIPTIWTSPDGRIWNRAVIDSTPFEFGEIDAVAARRGGLIAVGEVWDDDRLRGPAVWASPDGLAWARVPGDPLGTSEEPMSLAVAVGAGGVVVTGVVTPLDADGPGPIVAWWSDDGVAWERVPDIASFTDGSRPAGVVPFGRGFVMVGSRGARVALVWTSPDGRRWTDPEPLPVRPITDSTLVFGLATDGAVLIAYGDDVVFGEGADPAVSDASIWMSVDGVDWQQVPPESLRSDAVPDQPSPVALLGDDTDWILLGGTVDVTTDTGIGVAWFGRRAG